MKQNWEIKKLGEVCEKKQNIKWKDESNESYYSYIDLSSVNRETNQIDETQKINAFNAPSRAQQIVKEGDVIFGTTRPTLKRVCIIPSQYDNQICSTGFCVLRANKKLVYPTWIYHFLLSEDFYKYIEPLQRGANYPAVTDSDVMNTHIPVPPLADQRRIVSILDEKFSQIETLKSNAQKNLDNAEQLWKAQLEKQFDNQKWEKKKLGEVCDFFSGFAFDSKGYSSNPTDMLLICGDNIINCKFRWDTIKRWPKEKCDELSRFALEKEDIVLAMDRPWVKSGLKIAQIGENELPSLLIQRTACIRVKQNVLSDYIFNYLQVEGFTQYLIKGQTGIGVPHISGKQIINFEIPLPPLAEQERIVKELDALSAKINTLKANYRRQIECCDELRQSLLKKAFEGEL